MRNGCWRSRSSLRLKLQAVIPAERGESRNPGPRTRKIYVDRQLKHGFDSRRGHQRTGLPGAVRALATINLSLGLQPSRMPADMIGHEGRDEIIAVVVARLPAEGQRNASIGAGALEQLRPQLALEERVGIADIDQQVG